jgi:hypothetical protein
MTPFTPDAGYRWQNFEGIEKQSASKMRRYRIAVIVVIIFTVYGFLSGVINQNYGYSIPPENKEIENAMEWKPSIIWLPGFILCHTRGTFGMQESKIGYYFQSSNDRIRYMISSTILGFALGLLALYSTTLKKWRNRIS